MSVTSRPARVSIPPTTDPIAPAPMIPILMIRLLVHARGSVALRGAPRPARAAPPAPPRRLVCSRDDHAGGAHVAGGAAGRAPSAQRRPAAAGGGRAAWAALAVGGRLDRSRGAGSPHRAASRAGRLASGPGALDAVRRQHAGGR